MSHDFSVTLLLLSGFLWAQLLVVASFEAGFSIQTPTRTGHESRQKQRTKCKVRNARRQSGQLGRIFLGFCLGDPLRPDLGLAGPYFRYSDTWQLVINTATTVITFLIVFLIQNTQNRDARALHLKLDEVIRALNSARNEMINIETLSDAELEHLAKRYERFSEEWKLRNTRDRSSKMRPAA